jgi:RNA polymerase-interacting CarD/CdnL/TRCF family regulator
MPETEQGFNKGDWIVHLYHGVGQIKGVEEKPLNGKMHTYYRVKTYNSILWIPVDNADNDRIRPLSTEEELDEALKALQKPPHEMDPNHSKRKGRIRDVKSDGSLLSICRLVRDLSARRMENRLNATEQRALQRLEDRLVREWSVCKHIGVEEAAQKLNEMLQFDEVVA